LAIEDALKAVRLVVFDFDGVFTDNRVWVNGAGDESVVCSRADGFGLRRLDEAGVDSFILTKEAVPVVAARARKLRIACIQGVEDKLPTLVEEASRRGVPLAETAYVGNDVNDCACLEAVGLPVVPADAWPEAREKAGWVLTRRGGEGCVRELCDAIWQAKQAGTP
jgi:3-deoxy-D-manno-octulosonate 8-phosphate phosphatase (KDO 8-P phosphatase)